MNFELIFGVIEKKENAEKTERLQDCTEGFAKENSVEKPELTEAMVKKQCRNMEEMTHKTPGRVGVNIRNIGVNIKKPKYPAFMQSKVAQYLDWNKIFTRLNDF